MSVLMDSLVSLCFVEANLKSTFYAPNTHQAVVQRGIRTVSVAGEASLAHSICPRSLIKWLVVMRTPRIGCKLVL